MCYMFSKQMTEEKDDLIVVSTKLGSLFSVNETEYVYMQIGRGWMRKAH
jgi:hypothetical protein